MFDQLFNAVLANWIPLVVIAIGGLIVREFIPTIKEWIKSHTDANTLSNVQMIVMSVIHEAEAKRVAAALAGEFFDVLEWAFEAADERLNDIDIDLDSERLFGILRASLLAFLASQGISLDVPDVLPPAILPMEPLTDEASASRTILQPRINKKIQAARDTLAARLWV